MRKLLYMRSIVAMCAVVILSGCGTSVFDKGIDTKVSDGSSGHEGNNGGVDDINTIVINPSPSVPKKLTISTDAEGIYLNWEDTLNEDGFRIARDGNIIGAISANVTDWKDFSVTDGITYCYMVMAFNKEGTASSNRKCVTFSLLNEAPQIWIDNPMPDELVYKLTRTLVGWRDSGNDDLALSIFINNEEQMNEIVEAMPDISTDWLEVDFTDFPDGAHTITVEVHNAQGLKATEDVLVYTDDEEVEQRAVKSLYDHSSTGSLGVSKQVVRWASIPVQLEVSPRFTAAQFQIIDNAAEFIYRYTGIPFEVYWSKIDSADISACAALPSWFDVRGVYIYPHTPSGMSDSASAVTCVHRSPSWNISSALIQVAPGFIADYASNPEIIEAVIAHELGHSLPFSKHEEGNYLMKLRCIYPCYRLSPEMVRAMEKLYFEMNPGDLITVQE